MNKPNPSKKERTKKQIMEAGLALFQNPGFFNTDIRAIAREAGISLGSFYNYFKDKLSLYLSIYRDEHDYIFDDFVDMIQAQDLALTADAIFHYLMFQLRAHKHSKTFYIEADLLALLEPEVKKLQVELNSKAIKALSLLFPPGSIGGIDTETALPLLYQLVENTIHSITEESSETQFKIMTELSKMIFSYLSHKS